MQFPCLLLVCTLLLVVAPRPRPPKGEKRALEEGYSLADELAFLFVEGQSSIKRVARVARAVGRQCEAVF